jgi:hypothetical protein
VLLLGADSALLTEIWNGPKQKEKYYLDVKIDERRFKLEEEYEGQAIWFGCRKDDGLDVPALVREGWQKLLKDKPDKAPRLLSPCEFASLLPVQEQDEGRRLAARLGQPQGRTPQPTIRTIQLFLYQQPDNEKRVPFRTSPVYFIPVPQSSGDMVQPVLIRDRDKGAGR